jgi:hypothetical protein
MGVRLSAVSVLLVLSLAPARPILTQDFSPRVRSTIPAPGATAVRRDAFVSADVIVPNGGIDPASLSSSSVKLTRSADGQPVAAVLNTSGGGDVIVLRPVALLEANTSYTFQVTSALTDIKGVVFVPYSMTFTTGTETGTADGSISFEKVALPTTAGRLFTAVTIGPDGLLYAAVLKERRNHQPTA